MIDSTNCTIVVLSCDKYSDLWNPFFKLLSIQWENCNLPVVLVTESKQYNCEYMEIKTFNPRRPNVPWSRRVLECLKSIKTKYIILMMDDFFLKSKVLIGKLNECFVWMEATDDLASISFVPSLWEDIALEEYGGFVERPKGGLYRVNCQIALWNREKLIKLIRPYENPWDFEWMASCRADRTEWRFLASNKEKPWVFDYDFGSGGGGVHRGKWSEGVKELFDQYEIQMDYEQRGWDDEPAMALSSKAMPNPKPDTYSLSIKGRMKYILHNFPDIIKAYF